MTLRLKIINLMSDVNHYTMIKLLLFLFRTEYLSKKP